MGDIAIVDLLPGGFDPVHHLPPPPDADAPAQGDDATGAAPPPTIRAAGSTWKPDYTDVREDRVVIYGIATPDVQEYHLSHQGQQQRQIRRAAGLWRVDV